jgi:hypothetical protein
MWWLIACTAEPPAPEPTRPDPVTAVIGPEGGSVSLAPFSVDFPPGALDIDTEITVTQVLEGWIVDPQRKNLGAVAWATMPAPAEGFAEFTLTKAGLLPVATTPTDDGVQVPLPALGPVLAQALVPYAGRPTVTSVDPGLSTDGLLWTLDGTINVYHELGAIRVETVGVLFPDGTALDLLRPGDILGDDCAELDAWNTACFPFLVGDGTPPPWLLVTSTDEEGDAGDVVVVEL